MINNYYGPGNGTILLDDVICTGSELSLANCSHSAWGTSDCTHDEDISIVCSGATQTSTTTTTTTTTTKTTTNTPPTGYLLDFCCHIKANSLPNIRMC